MIVVWIASALVLGLAFWLVLTIRDPYERRELPPPRILAPDTPRPDSFLR